MNHTISTARSRIPELDGVRGVAILMVLLWHYVQNQLVAEAGSVLASVKLSLGFAWSGVDLFFVLSGFLITGILLEQKGKSNYFKVFYIRRVCRIFPLYYLYLFIFILMLYVGAGESGFLNNLVRLDGVPVWSYATYTQNILMGLKNSAGPDWLGVTWSLAIEEQFYLVLPFIIYFISEKRLPVIFIWIVLTAIYFRFSMPGLSAYINTPWRADSLMIGALLAYYIRMPGFIAYIEARRRYLLVLLVLLTAGLFFANNAGKLSLGGAVTHISLAVLFGLLILYVIIYREGYIAGFMRSRMLMWLGGISYGVYLFHTNVSKIAHGLIRHAHPQISTWSEALVTMLALVVTLFLAQLSYRFFETRITAIGHKYKYT